MMKQLLMVQRVSIVETFVLEGCCPSVVQPLYSGM